MSRCYNCYKELFDTDTKKQCLLKCKTPMCENCDYCEWHRTIENAKQNIKYMYDSITYGEYKNEDKYIEYYKKQIIEEEECIKS